MARQISSDDRQEWHRMSFQNEKSNLGLPPHSQKNVWAYWETGFSSMSPWLRSNVLAWRDLLGPDWTVRVLDRVPTSDWRLENFIDMSDLPPAIAEGRSDGKKSAQHCSDFVRLACLHRYGGVWMDVSVLLIRHVDELCWSVLSDPTTEKEVAMFSTDCENGVVCAWFIAANKGSQLIKSWLEIFLAAWGERVNCSGVGSSVVLRPAMKTRKYFEKFDDVPESEKAYLQDYLGALLAWEASLQRCQGDGSHFLDRSKYERVIFLDAFKAIPVLSINEGTIPHYFDLLTTYVTPATPDSLYEEAKAVTQKFLEAAPMLKFASFDGGTNADTIAKLLSARDDRISQEQAEKATETSKVNIFMDILRKGNLVGKSLLQDREEAGKCRTAAACKPEGDM